MSNNQVSPALKVGCTFTEASEKDERNTPALDGYAFLYGDDGDLYEPNDAQSTGPQTRASLPLRRDV